MQNAQDRVLVGYITKRDEDGSWYLMDYVSQDLTMLAFTQIKAECVYVDEHIAKEIILAMQERKHFQPTFHATLARKE